MSKRILWGLVLFSVVAFLNSGPAMPRSWAEPLPASVAPEKVREQLNSSTDLITKGEQLIREDRLVEAMEAFHMAQGVAPFDHRPYANLAKVYIHLKLYNQALKILEEAGRFNLHMDELFADVKLLLGWLPASEYFARPGTGVWIAPFRDNKICAVSLSFDDGAQSVYTRAMPILDKFGWKASFFLNPSMIESKVENIWWGSWEQWRDAHGRGYEIANHGFHHRGLLELNETEREAEINGAYDVIQREVGEPPASFAFPHDLVSPMSLLTVRERHSAVRHHDTLLGVYDRIFIPVYGGNYFSVATANALIELGMAKNFWIIPECHAVKEEGVKTFKPMTEEFLEQHLNYITSHEDQIWVDTFINVYRYLKLRGAATVEIQKRVDREIFLSLSTSLTDPREIIPLTVVIDAASDAPQTAWAKREGSAEPLDVKVSGGRIYLTAKPSTGLIHVKWE